MKIDLLPNDQWDHLNEKVKNYLGEASEVSVRVYSGSRHAVMETCILLAQIYSHKKSIAVVKGLTPFFDYATSWFMKEGFHVQQIDSHKLDKDITTDAWLEKLNKDTLFVLWAEDHALTGQYHDLDGLDQKLNDRKIFSLRVSHSRHLVHKDSVLPYTVKICSYGPELCVARAGERYRIQAVVASQMLWDEEKIFSNLRSEKMHISQFLVEDFEGQFHRYRYFTEKVDRSFDRAVLIFPQYNGQAIKAELDLALGFSEDQSLIETSSLCRWGGIMPTKHWWTQGVEAVDLRGLVIFSAEALENPKLIPTLKAVIEKIQDRQEW